MCRAGGRRCPSHSNPIRVAERNAVRRQKAAEGKKKPLSNAQYKHRVEYGYNAIAYAVENNQETHKTLATETPNGELIWTPERAAHHDIIVRELLDQWQNVPCEGKALFTGGLGGAGKSTVLSKFAGVNMAEYAVINPDDIKEVLAEKGLIPTIPGLSPMEASPLVHEEASHISKMVARILVMQRKNVIYDVTMTSYSSTKKKLAELKKNGYSVDAIFVDIPSEVSVERSQLRHKEGVDALLMEGVGYGGRLLPKEVMASQKNANPLGVFNQLKNEGEFGETSVWDNSVNGRAPIRKE